MARLEHSLTRAQRAQPSLVPISKFRTVSEIRPVAHGMGTRSKRTSPAIIPLSLGRFGIQSGRVDTALSASFLLSTLDPLCRSNIDAMGKVRAD